MATTKTFRHLFALAGILALFAILGRAQGVYDDCYDDGAYFYGDMEGYDDSGGTCNNGLFLWNDLDEYEYGTAYYPNDYDIFESLTNVDGSYYWNWGFSFDVIDPYGQCQGVDFSFSWPVTLNKTLTYLGAPNAQYPNANGVCYYQYEACSSGVPTCPPADEFPFPISFSCSGVCNPCPLCAYQYFWAVKLSGSLIGCPTYLLPSGAGGPGVCT